MTHRIARSLRLLALVLPIAACASTGARPSAGEAARMSDREIEELFRARMDSARLRFTDADVRFMSRMIGHHAQAVVISRLAPAREASPSVQTLAARIINAQQDEIEIMQQWLRDRDQPVPALHVDGTTVMIHGDEHAHHMPGMLSQAQVDELARARGAEFDRLFLTYMIEHHRGAVVMVRELFATDGAGQDEAVFKFASDVHVDQTTEIARMELMLDELPASGRAR